MNEQEVQAQMALIKSAPPRVKSASNLALLLGLAFIVKFIVAAYFDRWSYGKAIGYGLLLFILFLFNGIALMDRKRGAFISLTVLAALPVVGAVAHWLHLLRLLLEGTLLHKWPETLEAILALIQLAIIIVLFRQLYSKETRAHVWKSSLA